MKHLIIIGTGAFARELYGHAKNSIGYGTSWDIKGYIDGDVKEDAVYGGYDGVITEYDIMKPNPYNDKYDYIDDGTAIDLIRFDCG